MPAEVFSWENAEFCFPPPFMKRENVLRFKEVAENQFPFAKEF